MISRQGPVHTVMVSLLSVQHSPARRTPTSLPEVTAMAPASGASGASSLTIHELVNAHFDIVWRWLRAFGVHRDDAAAVLGTKDQTLIRTATSGV